MVENHLEIQGANGRSISIDYRYDDCKELLNPVIYVHGYKGFKDWGSSNSVADYFSRNDFFYLKFNFSHNGVTSENPKDFLDLNAFGNNNYWLEFMELGLVIDWLEKENLPINFSKLSVIGHSRGGGIVLLRTAQDARINKAITWASVCDFETRFPKDVSEWEARGVEYIYNGRTEQMMPLYFQLYTSFYEHKEVLDIPKFCLAIDQEVLVIHGANDSAVGIEESHEIIKRVKNSKLEIIEKAGHTFGGVHPAITHNLPSDLIKVANLSIDFLR